MSEQPARTAVAPDHRSVLPNIPGVPWWGAVLIAAIATAIGYAIDAGHKELSHVFAGCYIAGCVAAVLAVRRSGIFTAVIQPPLLLFCTVPGAYWLFHGRKIGSLKDLLINCGYPLIERFPLMLGTAGGVLLIGLLRWFFGGSKAGASASADGTEPALPPSPALGGIVTKLTGLFQSLTGAESAATDAGAEPAPPAGHARRGSSRTANPRRGGRPTERPTRTRSRHTRPVDGDPAAERPRRPARRSQAPDYEGHGGHEGYEGYDAAGNEPPRRPRRPRPDLDPRVQPPREARRDPQPRRNPYERPTPRTSRFDSHDRYEQPPGERYRPSERPERPERRERPHQRPYEGSYEQFEPPRRRPAPGGPAGPNGSTSSSGTSSNGSDHHPISRVRYRGDVPREPRREPHRDEQAAERRRRSSPPRRPPAESWE